MMNRSILFFAVATLLWACGPSADKKETETSEKSAVEKVNEEISGVYTVNSEESKLQWTGKKPTGEHYGSIQVKSGSFDVDNGKLAGGSFIIDMTSIKVLDIEDEEYNQKLEGHLKNEDFFNVDSFPEAQFVIKNASITTGNEYNIVGDLTVKGITNEIDFKANVEIDSLTLSAKTNFSIDRTKWDVHYKSKSIFKDIGDKFIFDDIDLDLTITASRK